MDVCICIPCPPDTPVQVQTESNENIPITNLKGNYNNHLNKKKDCTPGPKGKRKCEHPGCRTHPSYGHDGKATHCGKHKQPDMESTRKTCEHPGCRTKPSFGHDGKATHCSIHKQPDMESTRKTCEHGRARDVCPDCQGPVISKKICKICITTRLGNHRRIQLGMCAKCDDASVSELKMMKK